MLYAAIFARVVWKSENESLKRFHAQGDKGDQLMGMTISIATYYLWP